jgi:two-component system, NtrC family, response regulator AtoC
LVTENKPTLLIVDDDRANLDSYSIGFARHPYRLVVAAGGEAALEILKNETVDVVLTDLKMPRVDGLEVVRAAAALPVPPVSIVITAYGTIETAVEAMRRGAFDYITKPVNLLELRGKVEKALEVRALRVRGAATPRATASESRFRFEGVVGESKQMREVAEQARIVAKSRASVLIEGESGTGKELIARAIHFNSPRATGPFVPIHCAALPETLLESELFGFEKGSFTGAQERRIGQFESAHGGTVFLDELAEIPVATQVKLLRVLEERQITRVGSTTPISIDIRLVGATNKHLDQEVKAGRFREDLYYRLNVVRIQLPPLRERPDDVPPLVHHFLKELAEENERPQLKMTPEAMQVLVQHPWYGNVRELRKVIEQIVVFARSEVVGLDDLPASMKLLGGADTRAPREIPSVFPVPQPAATVEMRPAVATTEAAQDLSLAELERRHIIETLEKLGGNRTHAARHLGISRRTLQRKLKELGLE